MTEDELLKRCVALANVGDSAAEATIRLHSELLELRKASLTPETETIGKARYVLSNIACMMNLAVKMGLVRWQELPVELKFGSGEREKTILSVPDSPPAGPVNEHAKEVAAYDAKAKELYAKTLIRIMTLFNRTVTKAEAFSLPELVSDPAEADRLAGHVNDYIRDFGLMSRDLEFLRGEWSRLTGKGYPPTPENFGFTNTTTAVIDDLIRTGYATQNATQSPLGVGGAAVPVARPDDVTQQQFPDLRRAGMEALRESNKASDPSPEEVAAAATRVANGLPPETDPAVTLVTADHAAGSYDKSPKMDPKSEGAG